MKERYDNLDGLRVISCLLIIAMHIQANAKYDIPPLLDELRASWTHFVALFIMISGFGMFCGYYERFKDSSMDLNSFYNKRYKKILPFFITLILIDVVVNRSRSHIMEGIMESTLVFGLLPNNQPNVIGVSWTIGVIFLFYMLFPFVVFICWDKKRAIISFAISICLSLITSIYYFSDVFVIEGFASRHNILYCSPWFIGGGIVYLYRESIKKIINKVRWIWLGGCLGISVIWYLLPNENSAVVMLKNTILFMMWLMYAISVKSAFLSNGVMKYLSGISLELYLGQMVIYRVIEKLHLLYLFENGIASYFTSWIIIVIVLIAFIELWKRTWNLIYKKIRKKE